MESQARWKKRLLKSIEKLWGNESREAGDFQIQKMGSSTSHLSGLKLQTPAEEVRKHLAELTFQRIRVRP